MTVAELIAELAKHPGDCDVVVGRSVFGNVAYDVVNVVRQVRGSKVALEHVKPVKSP